MPSSSAKKPQVVSNFLHFEVHKPVKQLNEVRQVHIRVDRIEFVSAQHSGMLASMSSMGNCACALMVIMVKEAGAIKACRQGMRS